MSTSPDCVCVCGHGVGEVDFSLINLVNLTSSPLKTNTLDCSTLRVSCVLHNTSFIFWI